MWHGSILAIETAEIIHHRYLDLVLSFFSVMLPLGGGVHNWIHLLIKTGQRSAQKLIKRLKCILKRYCTSESKFLWRLATGDVLPTSYDQPNNIIILFQRHSYHHSCRLSTVQYSMIQYYTNTVQCMPQLCSSANATAYS